MILALLDRFKTSSKENLKQRALKQDMSFSVERLPYGHFAIGEDYITEESVYNYHIMVDDIYYELCVAMSKKTWPLMSHLDDLILLIAQSGIQQYVELTVVMENSNNKLQAAVEHSRHRESIGPIKLTPSHITGPFIILAIGLIVALLAFGLEIGYSKLEMRKLQKSRSIWY
jgi:hypothetical protein